MRRSDIAMLVIGALLLIIPLVFSTYQGDSEASDFGNGTFNQTRWNESGYLELTDSSGNHSNGTFLSRIFDAALFSRFVNISWSADLLHGNVTVAAGASTNASTIMLLGPDGTSDTSYAVPGLLNVSDGRYFQYLLRLETLNVTHTPKVYHVRFAYLPHLPEIMLVMPEDNASVFSHAVNFSYVAGSHNPIMNCSLLIDGVVFRSNATAIRNGTSNNISAMLGNGNYSWTISCEDPLGNRAEGIHRNLSVAVPDTKAPTIDFGGGTLGDGMTSASPMQIINVTTNDSTIHSSLLDWEGSLLGWFTFETVSLGAVNDSSGNGRVLALINSSASPSLPGVFGQGVMTGEGMMIGEDDAFSIDPNTSLTVEMWFLASNGSEERFLATTASCQGLALSLLADGRLRLSFGTGGCGNGSTYVNETASFAGDLAWRHVAAVVDRPNEEMRLYLDGGLVGREAIDNSMYSNAGNLTFGVSQEQDGLLNGKIDEVRIWKRAISSAEINSSIDSRNEGLVVRFLSLTDGNYSYIVHAIDSTGNTNSSGMRGFAIDTVTAPAIMLDSPVSWLVSAETAQLFDCSANNTNFNTHLESITFYWNASGGMAANGSAAVSGLSNTSLFARSGIGDGSYLWNCYACDNASNCAFNEDNHTFRIDTMPPIISSVQNGSPTNVSVLIAWNTDENANATIRYGTDPGMLDSVNSSGFYTTVHNLYLTGLTNSTVYHYSITCCDVVHNCVTEGPYTVTSGQNPPPDLTAPTISDVTNASTTATSTAITFATGELANASVRYGLNFSLSLGGNSSFAYSMMHSLLIRGLTNRTMYYYNVTACDPDGNCNTTGPHVVTTLRAPDLSDPVITLNNPQDTLFSFNNTIVFNCTVIDYNLSNVSLFGNWSGNFSSVATDHSGANGDYLFNRTLDNGSYSWACHACDADGNCVHSSNWTIQVGWAQIGVVSTMPENGTTNASVITPITIRLNSPIDESTINSSIKLLGPPGPLHTQTSYDPFNYIVTLSLYTPLRHNTTYTINISERLRGILGTTLPADHLAVFRTMHKDTDLDGIPDINDTDSDGDGIDDTVDMLLGDAGNIHSNTVLTVTIDGFANLSQIFTGVREVSVSDPGGALVSFIHDFDALLDLTEIAIIKNERGPGSLVAKGIDATKTVWIDSARSEPGDACVKDSEIESIDQISEGCDASDETFLRCDGIAREGYTCSRSSERLEIAGLRHSGVVEQCREQWECSAWVPMFCYLGWNQVRECTDMNQCNTTRYQPMTTQICENPVHRIRKGCRLEWECSEWGGCVDGKQERICTNVGTCPDAIKPPLTTQDCAGDGTTVLAPDVGDTEASESTDTEAANVPETEQPRRTIFDDDDRAGSDDVESTSDEGGRMVIYLIIIFIVLMLTGLIFTYRNAFPIFPAARSPRYIDVVLKEKRKHHKLRTRKGSWGLFCKRARRFRDIMKLQKMKRFRKHEIAEIRTIAKEVKRSGEDSMVARFLRFDIEEPVKIEAPSRPVITVRSLYDKMICWMYHIPHEREGSVQTRIDALKGRMTEGDKNKDRTTGGDPKEVVAIGPLMAKLRGFDEKVGHDTKAASFIESFTKASKERVAKLGLSRFSVKDHRKTLADLERAGLVYRWVREHDGVWRHDEWVGLLGKVKDLGYDVEDYELGPVLEMEKKRYHARKDLGK